MYAIIRFGGKQYKVSKGDKLVVDKIAGNPGDRFDITDVMMTRDDKVSVANLSRVRVAASIIEHFKDDKVLVFKYKAKKNYRRKFGHRSHLSKIKIEDIKISRPGTAKKETSEETAETKPAKETKKVEETKATS